jgi:cytochrome c peroxidase
MLRNSMAVAVVAGVSIAAACTSISDVDQLAREPQLPAVSFQYAAPLPAHFAAGAPNSPAFADNTPLSNPITDAGATLGRVLFYDKRLSANNTVSCGSCHLQSRAFSDTARFSRGFKGGRTARNSMTLGNARFYFRGRFFWDERALNLETQVLLPIQDSVEMGMKLEAVAERLRQTPFYPQLFEKAFGSSEVTSDRIARALAQFVRSLVSANSKFDAGFRNVTPGEAPGFALLTPQERQGMVVFNGAGGCSRCHGTNGHIAPAVFNNGLDATITDAGAGGGRFKAASLRNIELTAPYMHDGRFATLEEVVEHYDNGVRASPTLDIGLRGIGGQPRRLNLSPSDKAALVAFLKALTDQTFITDPRFSDPFR